MWKASTPQRANRSFSLSISIPPNTPENPVAYYGGGDQSDTSLRSQPRRSLPPIPRDAPSYVQSRPISPYVPSSPVSSRSTRKLLTAFRATCGPDNWSDDYLKKLETLGSSSGIMTHRVLDRRTGAIMTRKSITMREVTKEKLVRQIVTIATVTHKNLVPFMGAYISPSNDIKVLTDFCSGGSLRSTQKLIGDREAVVAEKILGRIAEGILHGLAYLESLGLIHGNLTPSNILFTRDGIVKLSDFSLSEDCLYVELERFSDYVYIAPERVKGLAYGIRADVWSAGLCILEFVQNQYPYPNLCGPQLLLCIAQDEPPRLAETRPDIEWSDAMKDFITQSLQFASQLRPTPSQLLEHPWIRDVMSKEDRMHSWIRRVRRESIRVPVDQSHKPMEPSYSAHRRHTVNSLLR